MENFNFIGRPDGLGNRLEENNEVSSICYKKNITENYVWCNQIVFRDYDILITSKNLKITKKAISNIPTRTISDLAESIEREKMIKAAKGIIPTFNICFKNNINPVGVHIRGTDRIKNNNHPHFMKNKKEFLDYLSKVVSLVNIEKPEYVCVCSDDKRYRNIFIENLDKSIQVITPICDKQVPNEYRDFFALTLCKEIYMCSKFSTFSIMASIIGNSPIVALVMDAEVAERYKAQFRYETDLTNLEHLSYNENLSLSNLLNNRYYGYRLLTMCKNVLNRFRY